MAYVVMAYVVMAYVVIAYVVIAYVVMAYIVMACVVMACVVMAHREVTKAHLPYVVGECITEGWDARIELLQQDEQAAEEIDLELPWVSINNLWIYIMVFTEEAGRVCMPAHTH